MNIFIKETSQTETLSIVCPKSGVDYTADFIGNGGGFLDGQLAWDDERSACVCDQETFDWWDKVVSDNQELENRIFDLVQKHGFDAVYAVVNESSSVDLEDLAKAVNNGLDEIFGEQKSASE